MFFLWAFLVCVSCVDLYNVTEVFPPFSAAGGLISISGFFGSPEHNQGRFACRFGDRDVRPKTVDVHEIECVAPNIHNVAVDFCVFDLVDKTCLGQVKGFFFGEPPSRIVPILTEIETGEWLELHGRQLGGQNLECFVEGVPSTFVALTSRLALCLIPEFPGNVLNATVTVGKGMMQTKPVFVNVTKITLHTKLLSVSNENGRPGSTVLSKIMIDERESIPVFVACQIGATKCLPHESNWEGEMLKLLCTIPAELAPGPYDFSVNVNGRFLKSSTVFMVNHYDVKLPDHMFDVQKKEEKEYPRTLTWTSWIMRLSLLFVLLFWIVRNAMVLPRYFRSMDIMEQRKKREWSKTK